MGHTINGLAGQERTGTGRANTTVRGHLEGLRADLAQLDEWLTKCEELRVLDRDQLTRALGEEIAGSPVAPSYVKREARRRDRAILQVTDAIFLAQGTVMLRLNILEGSVLWKDPVETIGRNGKVKYRDEAGPEDFRITRRALPSRSGLRPLFHDSERLSA
jgi:hypothetical protein